MAVALAAALTGIVSVLAGCETTSFYQQAIVGQLKLLHARKPVSDVLARGTLDAERAQQLGWVARARDFADKELQLPVAAQYQDYVQLHRRYVVWNVFAAPALELAPKQWCYPIVGCAVYRGYFAEAKARAYATQLRDEGLDVFVGGVSAYSTLGWFNDPVLSSFLSSDQARVVGLIFHELAHARVFVPGDSTFNESFASLVEEEGLRRWFAGEAGRAQSSAGAPAEVDAVFVQYQTRRALSNAFTQFVLVWRDRIAAEYLRQREAPQDERLATKDALFAAMKAEYAASEWAGSFDGFFADLNNARLLSIGAYYDQVPAFRQLLSEQAGDLVKFYEAVEHLAQLSSEARSVEMGALAARARASDHQQHKSVIEP